MAIGYSNNLLARVVRMLERGAFTIENAGVPQRSGIYLKIYPAPLWVSFNINLYSVSTVVT